MTPFKFPPPPPPPPPSSIQQAPMNDAPTLSSSRGRNANNTSSGYGRGWQTRGTSHANTRQGRGGRGGRGFYNGGKQVSRQGPGNRQIHPQLQSTMSESDQQRGMVSSNDRIPHWNASTQVRSLNEQTGEPRQSSIAPTQTGSPESNRKRKRTVESSGRTEQHHNQRSQQAQSKPPKAKSAPAPAIPSFGFSLPSHPITPSSNAAAAKDVNTLGKQRMNLGLTTSAPESDGSDDGAGEDIDEEAAYALLPASQRMTFEHEGRTVSLQTPADIAAWIEDRRKQYPTRLRSQIKAQEKAEKRASELMFLRKVKGGPVVHINPEKSFGEVSTRIVRNPEKDGNASHAREIDSRSTSTTEGQPSQVTGKPKVDLGLGYGTDSNSGDESSVLSESSVVSSSGESDDEGSDEESDENEMEPEKLSSKIVPCNAVPPPPPSRTGATGSAEKGPRACPHWLRGNCKYKYRCKLAHPPREENKKLSLYERLVEQESAKTDRYTLDAIKWLGQHGFLG